MQPEYIDTADAATMIGLKKTTLQTYRSRGGGPRFVKAGRRVLYKLEELRAWMDARLVTNTSECVA